MIRLTWLAVIGVAAGCGDEGAFGEDAELACFQGGPRVVNRLVARDADLPIAVETSGRPWIYDRTVEIWHPITTAPEVARSSTVWTIAPDGGYLNLTMGGLFRSFDATTWERMGSGYSGLFGYSYLTSTTSDGSYWFLTETGVGEAVLHRLLPAAQTWTPAFQAQLGDAGLLVKEIVMGRDGAIWISTTDQRGRTDGLFRVTPDGSQLDRVLGCDSPLLLFCQSFIRLTVNERGDLTYYSAGDSSRFFTIAVGTITPVERARLAIPPGKEFPRGSVAAQSFAVSGDTLFVTARTEQIGGTAYLLASDPGDADFRIVTELQDRNALLVVSSDGEHLYTHNTSADFTALNSVCEVK